MNIKAVGHLRTAVCLVSFAVTSSLAMAAPPAQITIPGEGVFPESTQITLDRQIKAPDGMRSFGRNSLLLIDGANGGELSKVTLTDNGGTVENLKTGFSEGPVAVAVVGTTAYVLEGQSAGMRHRPGDTAAPALKPFKATAVAIGKP